MPADPVRDLPRRQLVRLSALFHARRGLLCVARTTAPLKPAVARQMRSNTWVIRHHTERGQCSRCAALEYAQRSR